MKLRGQIVDIIAQRIFKGELIIEAGKITKIIERDDIDEQLFILPGLVDAHIHIESSMLIPSEFARLASVHGTVATVSDPHEIANVLGMNGVVFMIENGEKVPFKFFFGAPGCVPATPFETSGAALSSSEVELLLQMDDIKYLSEMMNFPGVLFHDKEVWAKLDAARKANKPIDGHAPGLKGADADAYIQAGITTDHECFTLDEAIDKINRGMMVQIREGSAARNYESLKSLLNSHPDMVMLCSDDKHPNDLVKGHINQLIKRALADGFPLMNVLRSCILNPVAHYKLNVGMLQQGHSADCIVVDNLQDFNVLKTYVNGQLIAENGVTKMQSFPEKPVNKFYINSLDINDLRIENSFKPVKVIEALEGELITNKLIVDMKSSAQFLNSDPSSDILKILVLNRYEASKPALGFIKGIGLKRGAFASSVAHDSHNIVAVGVHDADLLRAVELINLCGGGVCCVYGEQEMIVELPVAGIMSNADGYWVAEQYEQIDGMVKGLGSPLRAPFMTLSFMALLVIPELKLSDKGLFDGKTFEFTSLVED